MFYLISIILGFIILFICFFVLFFNLFLGGDENDCSNDSDFSDDNF